MPEILVNIKHWLCNRCGWKWVQRGKKKLDLTGDQPRVCPKCHSPRWNDKRKNKIDDTRKARTRS